MHCRPCCGCCCSCRRYRLADAATDDDDGDNSADEEVPSSNQERKLLEKGRLRWGGYGGAASAWYDGDRERKITATRWMMVVAKGTWNGMQWDLDAVLCCCVVS